MLSKIIEYLPRMYKALTAGIAAGIPAYAAVAQQVPWYLAALSALGAAVIAGYAVWQTPNIEAPADVQSTSAPSPYSGTMTTGGPL